MSFIVFQKSSQYESGNIMVVLVSRSGCRHSRHSGDGKRLRFKVERVEASWRAVWSMNTNTEAPSGGGG